MLQSILFTVFLQIYHKTVDTRHISVSYEYWILRIPNHKTKSVHMHGPWMYALLPIIRWNLHLPAEFRFRKIRILFMHLYLSWNSKSVIIQLNVECVCFGMEIICVKSININVIFKCQPSVSTKTYKYVPISNACIVCVCDKSRNDRNTRLLRWWWICLVVERTHTRI